MQDERKTKGELIIEVGELRQRLSIFEQEQQELKQSLTERKRAENIMHARLRLLKFAESHSLEEFTQATLDELEALTTSKIGFYHLVEADQRTLSLQTWSSNTLQHMCTAEGKGQHYDIAEAGVWVDCMHQRRPVIHNNYDALPHRKGMPPGHAPVVRELVVPIFRDSQIVAIIGVGNKPSDYDEWDVEMVSLLGDLSWDITERKRAEEELHRHREELQIIMDSVPAMIFYKDKENRFIQTNKALAEAMGLSKEELNGKSIFDLYPEQAKDYWKDDLEVISTGIPKRNIVEPFETGTGLKWVQTDKIPYRDAHGNIIGIIGFALDITEGKLAQEALKRAHDKLEQLVLERTATLRLANEQLLREIEERQQVEDRLRESEARFTAFMEHLPGLAVMRDMEGRYLFANLAWEKTMDLEQGDWQGKTLVELWSPERAAALQKLDFRIISSGEPIEHLEVQELADGPHYFLTSRFPINDAEGLPYMVGAVAIDITARRRAEQEVEETGRLYRVLSQVNEAIMRARDQESLFEQACRIVVEEGLFRMAWVGLIDPASQTVRVAAKYGFDEGYLDNLGISVGDGPESQGPTGTAVREDRYDICNDFALDPRMAPWRDKALDRGYRSSGAFPLRIGARVVGALTLYAHRPEFFTAKEIALLTSLADNLSFALEFLDREAKRRRAEEALRESERKLRYLADQLLTAQENERKRLAAELHDELGHALLALKLHLSSIEKKLPPEQGAIKGEILAQLDYINEVIQDVRRLYHDLSPGHVEDLGLTKALRTLITEFTVHVPQITLQVDLVDLEGFFSQPTQTIIYRIMQEALTNIGKHANPTLVSITAKKEHSQVHFVVQDNGQGFDVAQDFGSRSSARGVGLMAMEERLNMVGGSFEIQSRYQEGTRLSFTIPTLPEGNRP